MTTTLATLRSLVRERGGFTSADIAFPDGVIDRQINTALSSLMSASPNGWWWNHIEVTWQNTNADREYVSATPPGFLAYDVKAVRVQSVFVSRDGDFWQPLDYRTTEDATRLSGGQPRSSGLPLCYSTVQGQSIDVGTVVYNGVAMRFSPPLAPYTWLRFITTIGAPDLVAAGDAVQGWPDIWMDAVVEAAAAALMRQRKVLGSLQRRAMMSLQKAHQGGADEWLRTLKVYANRPYEGPRVGLDAQGRSLMPGVPTTLSDLRAAVREWCQADVNDPRASDAILNTYINAAIHRFTVGNPQGWSWDKMYSTDNLLTLVAGVELVTLHNGGELGGLSGDDSWVRIRSLELIHPTGSFRIPLERITRTEQLSRFPQDSDRRMPRTYSMMGYPYPTPNTADLFAVRFRPVPDLAYKVRVYGTSPMPNLVNDGDPGGASGFNDWQLAEWADCVVAYASFLLLRARADTAEAYLGAKTYFDEAVMALRKTNRIRVGAGIGNNPIADTHGELL